MVLSCLSISANESKLKFNYISFEVYFELSICRFHFIKIFVILVQLLTLILPFSTSLINIFQEKI